MSLREDAFQIYYHCIST